jgi:Rod binding domain-containing protein
MLQVGQLSLVQAANEFVNQVFYGPLLREMRDSDHNPYFGNGPGGKTFMRQLDMEMIGRMNGNKPSALAQSLIRQLGQNSQSQLTMEQVFGGKEGVHG